MTESKPNANFLYAFTPFSVGDRLGEHAEAARTAINDHTAALRELFVSQAQSGCDRLFTSVGVPVPLSQKVALGSITLYQ